MRAAALVLVMLTAAQLTPFSRLERAAKGDDYNEFKAALAAARAVVKGDEAKDALAVYTDVETLWDYANNSATGAFFDASTEGGALLSMLNRYPGFGHAIADATLETDGTTVYPTREARQFLAAEGARKLARMRTAPPEPRHPLRPQTTIRSAGVPPAPAGRLARPSSPSPPSPGETPGERGRDARTPSPPEKPAAAGGRVNLLLALILIVVGLGVIIFLFRASD